MTFTLNWLFNIMSVIIGALISGIIPWIQKKNETKLEAKLKSKEEQKEWYRKLLEMINNIDYSLYELSVLDYEDLSNNRRMSTNNNLSLHFKKLQYKLNSLKFEFLNNGYFSENSDLDISDELDIPFYVDPKRESEPEAIEKKTKKSESRKKNSDILRILKKNNNNNGKEKILIDLIDLISKNLMYYGRDKDSKDSQYMASVTSLENVQTVEYYMKELKNGIELYVYVGLKKINIDN